LSLGRSAFVAPLAGVVGAIVPILVGVMTHGFPGQLQFLGFGFALVGIWLVSSREHDSWDLDGETFGLGLLAGLGFGGFLALMTQLDGYQVFFPLVFARISGVLLAILMIWRTKIPYIKIWDNPLALLSGLLDTGGNFFYLTSAAFARIELIAVVSSLYPAATVLLSRLILKERVSRLYWLGVLVCVIAIGPLTL
jgi:drug/metabolite transporter (DMT)-like permease